MMEPHYLYFWNMEIVNGAVGHISLKVTLKNDDNLYISHWPKEHCHFKSYKKGHENKDSLLKDIKAESDRKPGVIRIPFDSLDPAKITKWRTETEEKSYHVLNWNCADVVLNALKEGLSDPELKRKLENSFNKQTVFKLPLLPVIVYSWVENELKDVKNQRLPPEAVSCLYAPLKPTDSFSGRSKLLQKVCESFKSPEKTWGVTLENLLVSIAKNVCEEETEVSRELVVITGIGGVGKTEFARKVAQELSDFFEGRIFWMNSETQEKLQNCLFDLSIHLKIPQDLKSQTATKLSKDEVKKLFQNIYYHFSTENQNSLFIFDYANQFKSSSNSAASNEIFLISDFLPNSFPPTTFSRCPAILITSRSCDWSESKDFPRVINLENFKLEETIEYFKKSFPKTPMEQLKEFEPMIKDLHGRVDGYPVAVTLAADFSRGYVHSQKLDEGLECYLQLFKRPSNDLHKKDENSSSSNTDYKLYPHEIMEQICAAIEKKNVLALKLLKQMSFLSTDFLTFHDFVYFNPEYDDSPMEIDRAFDTLLQFGVIRISYVINQQTILCPYTPRHSVHIIKIQRVILEQVKESLIRTSKDPSILFQMCETLLKESNGATVPHLKSLLRNLKELPFFLKSNSYIRQLSLRDQNIRIGMRLNAILVSIRKKCYEYSTRVYPRVNPESVIDNSDFFDSDELSKPTYQELANFVLQNVVEEVVSGSQSEISISFDILEDLRFLKVWPQAHFDEIITFLESQSLMEVKRQVASCCLENPKLTQEQRHEVENFVLKFELGLKTCFRTEQTAHNWINVLRYEKTLDGLIFSLTDDEKIQVMEQGIKAIDVLDDHALWVQFLMAIEGNCQNVNGEEHGEINMATKLLKCMLRSSAVDRLTTGWNFQKFAGIFRRLFRFSRPFSKDDLDCFMDYLESDDYRERIQLFCCFVTTISALSVLQREGAVSQSPYFKRLVEALNRFDERFEIIPNGCNWEDILKECLRDLYFFVDENKHDDNENAKEVVKMVQSVIKM